MANQNESTLLITGASGHLGRATLRHLIETEKVSPSRIIATTRRPDSLKEFADLGVSVRVSDFDEPSTLEAAFSGADRLLLISTDALDTPGKRLAQHRNAIAAAEKAGVKHILYTSLPEPESSAILFAPDHLGTEQAIAATSLSWTLLRNNWYIENLHFALPSALAAGNWYSAAGNGTIAYISREDVARASAAALASEIDENRTLTLTGSEPLALSSIAEGVSKVIGRNIPVVYVMVDQLTEGIVASGLPEPVAKVFASFDVASARGDLGAVTSDFQALTGRQPQTFAEWLVENTDAIRDVAKGDLVAH